MLQHNRRVLKGAERVEMMTNDKLNMKGLIKRRERLWRKKKTEREVVKLAELRKVIKKNVRK